ncbi:MAG: DUF488 domain-containing protein [Isosphaeraceae bacterium]
MTIPAPKTIWTIGHSNRDFETFLRMLAAASIALVADVRRFNGSKRHPQFGRDQFEPGLALAGIGYRHFEGLGGRRGRSREGSPNQGWRVDSFNAFADHMESTEFQTDLSTLIALAGSSRVALMCSEAVPWRCHRRLIADALTVRGWRVLDLIGPGPPKPHALTPFARVAEGGITYPAEAL